MAEYIERDAALAKAKHFYYEKITYGDDDKIKNITDDYVKVIFPSDIRSIPAVELAPVRHAVWKGRKFRGYPLYMCSFCGYSTPWGMTFYCSTCGSKMDGEPNEV